MRHFINNAQGGKTAKWMMQSQWKLCQLQLNTWGSSMCVCYFPSVRRFELTSVRHGVCRRHGYCDVWRSKIIHQLKLYVAKPLQKLLLLMKSGLETLNRSWNRSRTSGEVHPPHDPKNFDERNQRSSKWWSLLMITEESSWQSSMWNKCDSSVLSWLDARIAQKNAQKPTWLARGWATHFAQQCTPAPGEGCDWFAE